MHDKPETDAEPKKQPKADPAEKRGGIDCREQMRLASGTKLHPTQPTTEKHKNNKP